MANSLFAGIPFEGSGSRPLDADMYSTEQQGLDHDNISATGNLNIGVVINYDEHAASHLAGNVLRLQEGMRPGAPDRFMPGAAYFGGGQEAIAPASGESYSLMQTTSSASPNFIPSIYTQGAAPVAQNTQTSFARSSSSSASASIMPHTGSSSLTAEGGSAVSNNYGGASTGGNVTNIYNNYDISETTYNYTQNTTYNTTSTSTNGGETITIVSPGGIDITFGGITVNTGNSSINTGTGCDPNGGNITNIINSLTQETTVINGITSQVVNTLTNTVNDTVSLLSVAAGSLTNTLGSAINQITSLFNGSDGNTLTHGMGNITGMADNTFGNSLLSNINILSGDNINLPHDNLLNGVLDGGILNGNNLSLAPVTTLTSDITASLAADLAGIGSTVGGADSLLSINGALLNTVFSVPVNHGNTLLDINAGLLDTTAHTPSGKGIITADASLLTPGANEIYISTSGILPTITMPLGSSAVASTIGAVSTLTPAAGSLPQTVSGVIGALASDTHATTSAVTGDFSGAISSAQGTVASATNILSGLGSTVTAVVADTAHTALASVSQAIPATLATAANDASGLVSSIQSTGAGISNIPSMPGAALAGTVADATHSLITAPGSDVANAVPAGSALASTLATSLSPIAVTMPGAAETAVISHVLQAVASTSGSTSALDPGATLAALTHSAGTGLPVDAGVLFSGASSAEHVAAATSSVGHIPLAADFSHTLFHHHG